MAAALLPETASRLLTPETLRTAAKQSQGIHLVPISLRRAIKRYSATRTRRTCTERCCCFRPPSSAQRAPVPSWLRRQPVAHSSTTPMRLRVPSSGLHGGRFSPPTEISAFGTARMRRSRMSPPACLQSTPHATACSVRRRSPGFAPKNVLDFGAGPSSALWAMRAVWPKSIERVNLIEPSKEMQRAGQTLLDNLKGLPLIHSYDSIQELNRSIEKHERRHDLVISSYALGEIPSLNDRITIVRQLWDLTKDVLVLLEPGTPQGSKIISQMRSYILWMEKRKCRKSEKSTGAAPSKMKSMVLQEDLLKDGAFVVAPCPHDGRCPLENSDKYCHFVQRLERTSSQRIYKRSKGVPLRGFEDEKFCYVALRRGKRPEEAWPLDGMKFDTLKERHAKRSPEDLIIDYDDQFPSGEDEEAPDSDDDSLVPYASDTQELSLFHESGEEEEEEPIRADLGGGWGRIIYSPIRRGRQVQMDVCRATKRDASEGAFERVVVTQSKNPALHLQARKSLWGDLWPF
ncbi:unnamed protein product [Triticum turgidum subsp. durum]|uniref:Methyltransferase-like protein 17, mitochondrial n=1 Tax=Triticum turgidum subsp. durum TaxID=4567 RepID=A0A9R0QV32_TRITD|nr:unnamed protein product [Triticum turgidum subsp. durum]